MAPQLKISLLAVPIVYFLFSPYAADAAPSLPPVKLAGEAVEDLPTPYNLQAVVLNRAVTLTWDWDSPEPSPQFKTLGYEVYRDDKLLKIVPKTTHTDLDVPIGAHVYKVRIKGGAKDIGKKIAHYSAWSETAPIEIKLTCAGPPVINLTVTPTQKAYGSIPSLRLHFTGDISVPEGCRPADPVIYHIDSGRSAPRTGRLSVNSQGRFDQFVDALGAEDETMTGNAQFSIHITARNEMGESTSGVYTIDLEKENPFAPKQR